MLKKMLYLAFVIFICTFSPLNRVYAETNTQEIDIASSPSKTLFSVQNIKPGDWAVRNLDVQNAGNKDFKYTASIHFADGSKKLYKQLNLTIHDKNGVQYKGKLKNFSHLEYRKLKKAAKETLTLRIDFPADLGNEYQGLDCKFQVKLYAEGTGGGLLSTNRAELPKTGSNIFNFLTVGIILLTGGIFLFFKRAKLEALLKAPLKR